MTRRSRVAVLDAADEAMKRFKTDPKSAVRLAAQAAAAVGTLGIHDVSVTARNTTAPA